MLDQSIANSQEAKNIPIISSNNNTTTKTNILKILANRVVFLDLNNSYEFFKTLKECLNIIEAKVADCLSKEVDYLITNRSSSASAERDTSHKRFKTSPNAQMNFMHSKSLINRAHSILERASKVNISTSIDAVSTATRLGIKVVNVSEIEPYLQKLNRKSGNHTKEVVNTKNESSKRESLEKKSNILKLKSPFIKFESICKQYKPVYCEFKEWHDIDFESVVKNTCSPFQNYFSDNENKGSSMDSNSIPSPNNTTQQSTHNLAPSTSISALNNVSLTTTKSSKTNLANADSITRKTSNSILVSQPKKDQKQKKTGYCECCKQRYDNLKQHITSTQHENFEKNLENFKEIDDLINGPLNFERFLITHNLKNETDNKNDEFLKPNEIKLNEIENEKSNKTKSPKKIKDSSIQQNDGLNEMSVDAKPIISNNDKKDNNENMILNVPNQNKTQTDEEEDNDENEENLSNLSPIKKNTLTDQMVLKQLMMKSPSSNNFTDENSHIPISFNNNNNNSVNQILKTSPNKLNNASFQSPLSKIIANNYEESSSFNCIDDVVLAAFINDFSYELVENHSLNNNQNR